MNCPRCKVEFRIETHKGIEVDRCPECNGLWLDYPELDQLEDMVLADDALKPTLVYSPRPSELQCPRCQHRMTTFNYRANRLELELCGHGHGFWLDYGEDKKVQQFMKQRVADLQRSAAAEVQWRRFLAGAHSKSFFQKVKDFFRGR